MERDQAWVLPGTAVVKTCLSQQPALKLALSIYVGMGQEAASQPNASIYVTLSELQLMRRGKVALSQFKLYYEFLAAVLQLGPKQKLHIHWWGMYTQATLGCHALMSDSMVQILQINFTLGFQLNNHLRAWLYSTRIPLPIPLLCCACMHFLPKNAL